MIVDEDKEFIDSLLCESTALPLGTAISLKGMRLAIAPNLKLARESLQRIKPDIVLLDISVGDGEDKLIFLQEMSNHVPPIPVLTFTHQELSSDRVAIARRKSQGFFHKPIPPNRVFEAISKTLKPVKKTEAKILVVDDDRMTLRLLQTLLEPWGLKVVTLSNSRQFWDQLESVKPDLVILDIQMPNVDGIELCQLLRNDSRWAWLPIIFLTGQRDVDTIQQVFSTGADDFINKRVVAPELITRIFNRLERNRLLQEQAEINPLTGLPNRQRCTQDLQRLLHLANQYQQCFCLAVVKIDDLQKINRNYGHQWGDKMLRRLGCLLQKELRSEDIVSYWNGGEFVVGMYGMSRGYGVEWLAEVLEMLRLIEFEVAQETIHITFSAGVTQYPEDGRDIQTLFQSAASTMEKAKKSGGNCVLASDSQPLQSHEFPLHKDVILLYQDCAFANSIYQALLTRSYHAHWLKDGKTALQVLQEKSPTLDGGVILLEENLPILSGLEIVKHFKRNKVFQRYRVIWLSTTKSEAEKALRLGCLDYINVPCNISTFMYRLRYLLEG